MNSATNPETEAKRLEFWILSVRKFGEQLRCLSLYEEKNTSFHPQKKFPPQQTRRIQLETKMHGMFKPPCIQERDSIPVFSIVFIF